LENKIINIGIVAEVAEALGELKKDIVFVGGAIVSLYTDDPAADEIRPTKDIDMTLNIVNLNHWQQINEKLASLGFHPDPYGHAICSFKYKDIPVDIMAAEDGPLGSANRWYKIGFKNLWTAMAKQQEIQLLTAPCYLATKFEAFNDRGSDYRTSHDIEDIINIIDNRIGIVDEISKAEVDISNFIRQQFNEIIQQEMLKEVLISHIHPIMLEERMSIVEDKIIKILQN
jgi:predicted nucleotidyltransferase